MSEILTVREAAARAKLSEKTLYRALESGALVGSKVGNTWRIFSDDLEQWLVSLRPTSAVRPLRRPTRAGQRRPEPGSWRGTVQGEAR
jgi:excisionase family DNA binding protein